MGILEIFRDYYPDGYRCEINSIHGITIVFRGPSVVVDSSAYID